jgi:hypothetical protein
MLAHLPQTSLRRRLTRCIVPNFHNQSLDSGSTQQLRFDWHKGTAAASTVRRNRSLRRNDDDERQFQNIQSVCGAITSHRPSPTGPW